MRTYQIIWHALKKDKHCTITVHPALHARVIKAVIKEKDMDVSYKLTALSDNERCYVMKLSYKREGAMIRFFLRKVLNLARVTGKDLV